MTLHGGKNVGSKRRILTKELVVRYNLGRERGDRAIVRKVAVGERREISWNKPVQSVMLGDSRSGKGKTVAASFSAPCIRRAGSPPRTGNTSPIPWRGFITRSGPATSRKCSARAQPVSPRAWHRAVEAFAKTTSCGWGCCLTHHGLFRQPGPVSKSGCALGLREHLGGFTANTGEKPLG